MPLDPVARSRPLVALVVSIIALKPEGPDPALVAMAEELLRLVRDGEVVALALATVDRGNTTTTAWHRGPASIAPLHYAVCTLGAGMLGVQMDAP